MSVYFLDSSALAKRYIAETGSAWVLDLMRPSAANQIHISRICGAEVVAAITRRTRAHNMSAETGAKAIAQFRTDFEKFVCVEASPALVYHAMYLAEKNALRGYDSMQLAAALAVSKRSHALGMNVTLVSADEELNAAAAAEGLQVENPNLHP